MRLVIADTGPVNYPILIRHIDILPALFETVIRLEVPSYDDSSFETRRVKDKSVHRRKSLSKVTISYSCRQANAAR